MVLIDVVVPGETRGGGTTAPVFDFIAFGSSGDVLMAEGVRGREDTGDAIVGLGVKAGAASNFLVLGAGGGGTVPVLVGEGMAGAGTVGAGVVSAAGIAFVGSFPGSGMVEVDEGSRRGGAT